MERATHIIILTLISCFEIWMCYQILYRTVLEKRYLQTWQKILIWGNILGMGIALGINRGLIFFSHTIFVFCLLLTMLCIYILFKKNIAIKIEIIILYFTSLALLDFFCAFLSMSFIGTDFYNSIYRFSGTNAQAVLFLIPRGCMAILLVKWKQKIQEICEYKKALAILCITFLVLLRGYQIALGDMALGNRDMKGLTAAISMLVMFSMILGFLAFGHRFKMLKKENEMFAVREEMSRNHLEEIEKLMETNRIQIHDMRKHLLILKEYGQEQDWESLLRYLNELSNEMNQGKKSVWTHVKILDMVLNQEKIKAEKADIEFRIEEVAIGILPFTDTEVCALFGNLLDNAIEACYKIKHKKKWITVRFLRKAKMLYIEIVNSIEKKPKEKNGKLISDKSKNEVHGYGLKSVQKIIAKYNGEFDYQIREEEFEVKITFFLLENGGNWNE